MKYNLKKYSIRLFIKVFLIFLQLFVIVADLSAAPYKHKSYVPPKQYKQIYAPKTYQNTQRYINQRIAYQKKIKTRLEKNRFKQERIKKKNQAKIIRNARRDFKRQQNIGLTGKDAKIPVKTYRSYRYTLTGNQNSNKKQFINSLRNRTTLTLAKQRVSKDQQKLIRGKIDRLLKNYQKKPLWTSTKKKSPTNNAYRHFKEHGAKFEAKNSVDYVNKTQQFLRNPPSGTLTKTRSNGDIVRYNPSTNTFGVMDKTGAPRTMFKPDPKVHGYKSNMDYFNDQ